VFGAPKKKNKRSNAVRNIKGNDLKILRRREKNFPSFIKIEHDSKIKTERRISTQIAVLGVLLILVDSKNAG
jgi:hypothetical protein